MAAQYISVPHFISLSSTSPILDVRTAAEYAQACIPAAYSFPIFTNEERAEIGTAYKKISKKQAIKIGLTYFGSRLKQMVVDAEAIINKYPNANNTLLIHCWRGGMRSSALAWLLDFYGFNVYVLEGGYKAYRNWVLQQLLHPFKFNVIGGYTGSGKTEILAAIASKGLQTVDIEAIAKHKGSAFGNLTAIKQPTQEQFENNLLAALLPYYTITEELFVQEKPIWIEDESRRIGNNYLSNEFYENKQRQPFYFVEISKEKRANYILQQYGNNKQNVLIDATLRIQKKLGGLLTKQVVNYFIENDYLAAFSLLLIYYDKLYGAAASEHPNKMASILVEDILPQQIAEMLISAAAEKNT